MGFALKQIAPRFLDDMRRRASDSPRRRAHHNLHERASDPVQRLLVAVMRDAYFRVHRHSEKWELSILLQGAVDLLIFDGDGLLLERIRVAADGDTVLYEMPAGVYHTLVPQSDHSFFFEVKPGPYDPAVAAEFAAWSPAEGTIEAEFFAARLRSLEVGDSAAT